MVPFDRDALDRSGHAPSGQASRIKLIWRRNRGYDRISFIPHCLNFRQSSPEFEQPDDRALRALDRFDRLFILVMLPMPAIQYWISGTSFYLAGSFVFVVFVALIGIREMISRKSFIIFVAVALIFAILAWWTAAKQEKENTELRNILNSIGQTAPIIEALRRSENALHGQEQATAIIRRILNQYDRLLEGISVFEQITGVKNEADRRASAEHIISELRAMISGNVQLMGTPNGQALILKTAPNTFRITFSVPMRIAPNITFHGLPTGVTANILEKTNIGVTVVFTPSTIPVEAFPPSEFSADF